MTVLLADEIKRLCEGDSPMITPFEPGRLRPAGYQMTLGREIHLGGEYKWLDEKEGVVLEPHQVAVVCTDETLKIPGDLIARWSLRVGKIYEGLLWTGGPQVDPGWEGPLFCPIYNLAERNIVLKYGDPLFTIDFLRTTGISAAYDALKQDPKFPEIPFQPKRRTLADHDRYQLHSAPYEKLRNLEGLTEFRNFAIGLIAVLFAAIAAVVTALSVIVAGPAAPDDGQSLGGWATAAISIASVSLVISLFSSAARVYSWFSNRKKRR